MRTKNRQATACAIIASIMCLASLCRAKTPGPYAQQLGDECDALIQAAVKRPYGWAWEATPAPAPTSSKTAPRRVTMDPPGTPAAALVLLWSDQVLNEPRFKQAALDAARGVAASQANSGKILQQPVFGSSAGGREEPAVTPQRSSTCAGLAMLVAVIEAQDMKNTELLARAAGRATHWLLKQQSDDGGWPTSYPPDAPARDAQRLIRLDNADYRDCTLSLLLAADQSDDRAVAKAAKRSIDKLLALRLMSRDDQPAVNDQNNPRNLMQRAGPLWASAYRPDGSSDLNLAEFPAGADVIASKLAIQTLLGDYLMTGDHPVVDALDLDGQALLDLRRRDGTWRRVYPVAPTTGPATSQASGGVFTPPPPSAQAVAGAEIDSLLDAVAEVKTSDPKQYSAALAREFMLKHRMAAAVCGLSDAPFLADFPARKSDVAAYLKKYQQSFAVIQGPVPEDLNLRLKRLWRLLIRTKLEQLEQS